MNPSNPTSDTSPGPVQADTGANGAAADDEISLLDLFATIAENLKLLIIAPLLIGLAVLGISFLLTPIYTAQTRFLPPLQQQSAVAGVLQQLGGLAGAAAGIQDPGDQFVAFLRSRAIQDRLVERFDLQARYEAPNRELAARALADRTRITSGRDGLISVEFDDPDPAFAALVANAYVEELGLLNSRLALTEAQHRRKFFERQLEQTKAELVQAEQALLATGVNVRELNLQPMATVQAVAQLRAQVAAQEVQVASLRAHLTEAAPQLRQALSTLAALRGQLARLDTQERAALAPNPSAAGSAPGASHGGAANTGYFARLREFTFQQTMFQLMTNQYEMARLDESREGAVIQVLDIAQPPEQRSSPRRGLMATVASLAAGFALLLFVFVRQALRNASLDPASAAKLNAIRRSLGLRPTA
jgi:uncharacterized protein involved in exopolysaccharide biosynthesis